MSEAPLVIQYPEGDAYSGEYSLLDDLQHSDILPMDAYSGASAEITYIQHSTTLSLDAYAGETNRFLTFTIDPYYYHSDANNNFAFFCEYNAPVGEVNLVFPDTPCAAFAYFEAYSGERSYVVELLTADWLVFNYSGEVADVSLNTFVLIPTAPAYTGQNSFAALITTTLLSPSGYSGETQLLSTITIPPRAELSAIGLTGEVVFPNLAASYALDLSAYSGEGGVSSLTLTDYGTYILTEGPAAYWKFDEQSGTQAIDSTGLNSPATINGAVLGFSTPVASHSAFYFDGVSDTVVGNPISVISANLTQELWVKPDPGATITLYTPSSIGTQGSLGGQRYAVYPRYGDSGSGGGISVGSNGIQVVAHGNGYLPILLSYQQPISTTEFTHILVSWNDRTPTLYVNGVAVATGYQARAQFNSQGLPQSGTYGYYKGYMQDVAIYTSALTAAQAREHYLAGIGLHYIPRFEPVPAYSGEVLTPTLTPDLTPFGYIFNFAGEYTQAFLENNVRFYPGMYTGELNYLRDNKLTVVPNSTFTYFHGPNSHSETSTCITLQSAASSSGGINAGFYLPTGLNLQSISELNIRFKRTRAASWYDDDMTDAQLMLWLFPNWLTSEIIWLTGGWAYDRPEERTNEGGGNAQALFINLRYNANQPCRVSWFETTTVLRSGYLTVVSNFTTNELNGTSATRIKIVTGATGTTFTVYGENDEIRQSGTFASMPNIWTNARSTTNDIFLIHYHNYQSGRPEVICDLDIFEYEGFVIVPFFDLGITQAYSGENTLIDNLRTVSVLEPSAYSGETSEWLFSTNPSVDLGIITNPTGENAFAVLLTSSVMQIPNYTGEVSAFSVSFFPSASIGILQGYSGEREDLDLITYAIFRDIDAREGQNAATDLTTFPPALLTPVAYGDEAALFDLSVELAIEVVGRSGENALFLFDTHPSIDLGIVANYTGQRAETFALITSSVLASLNYTGENGLFAFTTFPSPELTLPFYEGSTSLLALATASLLDGKAYSGQYGTSTLTTFIGSTFTPIFYPGSTAEVALRTIDSLVPPVYTGQNTAADLTNYPATPLYPIAYSGETAAAAILPGITFPSISYDGGYGTFDLDYVVNVGLPAGWYDGERADFTLATTDALSFIGYAGENVLLYFGASFALYPSAYSGSYSQASLTLNLFDQIDSAGYHGQVIYPSLSTTTRLPNIGFAGENALFDLQQNLQPNILLIPYSGETVIASMQISFQLPVGRAYTGTYSVLNKIDSEPNTHFYADEALEAALSTTDTLKVPVLQTGENCLVVLQVGKSEGLGTFRAYPGTELFSTFDTKHHADLYVMFRTSIMTQVDIGSATYFDLNTDTCCGVRRESTSNNLLMHLFVKDYLPEAVSDGDRVIFSIDLRCNPRLSMEFGTGETFEFREYDGYLSVDFAEGTEGVVNSFEADLTHKLCKGYFVPNGNWLVVELNDVLPEDCYVDVFYSGTTMSCVLSDDIVIRVNNNYSGEHLDPTLTTFPPWEFIFRSGEILWCVLSLEVAMYPRVYPGETLEFRFYEEPLICYTGASGECELSIEYHVRFKETGCLDNDFAFQNEDGDLIAELANPVPVEGEPFYHSVLAECF